MGSKIPFFDAPVPDCAAVGGHLARIENTLRAGPVAGAALLLLIGVILWLLAVSTT